MGGERGFTLIELLVGSAIFIAAAIPLLFVAAAAQRLVRSQSEASDLYQRARVAAGRLQQDLAMAGAGPPLGRSGLALVRYVAPILPMRTGLRSPDGELSAFGDRLSILYVPGDGWQARLQADMPDIVSPIALDSAAAGCPSFGLCGFTEGTRAIIIDASGPPGGHDLFTVTGTLGALAHDSPNEPFARAYAASSAVVLPVVQRVYYLNRSTNRLMLYDGYQSDLPFIDHVVDLRFRYFVDAVPGPGLRPVPLSELSDGPLLGTSPYGFDADLQRIRLVRTTIRLQAAAEEARGAGPLFARPGRSTSGFSYVPDFEITFDVAPRNLVGPR